MHTILQKLEGSDLRSIGRVGEVVNKVIAAPRLFSVVFDGILKNDPVMRMHCADAVEKITRQHPEYLEPFKKKLIQKVAKIEQQEVRWHTAQFLSRLTLNQAERRRVHTILTGFLSDESRIVKTFTMRALADLADQDEELRTPIITSLEVLTRAGSPAMQSRGRKLLIKLKRKV